MDILVVCIGNMCRSPLAERLLQTRLDALGPGFRVSSAGTAAQAGREMEPEALSELERLGGVGADLRARRVSREMVLEADLVLTATKEIRTSVLQLAPNRMKAVFTLAEFAAVCAAPATQDLSEPLGEGLVPHAARYRSLGSAAPDVEDPIGRGRETHRQVADEISRLVDVIAPTLVRHVSPVR
jgi:protein-tyrosine phosphatase